MSRKKIIWLIIIVLDVILVYFNPSTFDTGDSVLHYVEAHQAWQTPHYFMNMWSKPLFILLSSPFAALGWWGMKLFNTACVLVSAYLTQRIFEHYSLNGWWGVFLSFFAYSFFLVQSSGLTEPLFMLGLTAIVYFELKDKTALAMTILSFLPFIRSEGYVVAVVILLYLLIAKKWKYLPYVVIGTAVYGIAGLFVFNDFLWMFHQNPYSGEELKYGSGPILHFLEQLPYVIGLPVFVFFFLGIFRGGMLFLKGKMELKELFLIYGVSVGYIAAHSIFWTYGLFHSFGLTRVLIVIIPLLAFIAYRGLEWLLCAFHFIHTKLLIGCFIAVIVVFPFIHNKMAINWQKDMSLTSEQSLMHDANSYIMKENLDTLPLYTNAYYYALLSGKIIDDSEQIARMYSLRNKHQMLIPNALILWDSYYAPTDAEIDTTYLQEQFQLKELKRWSNTENDMLILYEQH
jgi:hypothetical protein|tara:strand:- start:58120 stop:59493 length:1374 start_codon:yes stop_codon:yes gene_type:complete